MTDDKKPILCPWCKKRGIDVEMTKQRKSTDMLYGEDYYFCVECHSTSPHIHTSNGDWAAASEACYAAAVYEKPNRLLTDEQLDAMPDMDAVWGVVQLTDADSKACGYSASLMPVYLARRIGILGDFFRFKFSKNPTRADIDAAIAARAGGKGDGING